MLPKRQKVAPDGRKSQPALKPLRRILSGRLLLLVIGILPAVFIYTANPNNRVYSYHGMSHAAVSYQIANNTIPPTNPFIAGYPLHYHWGYHLLAAAFGKAFNMSPFVAFAVINVLSLLVALVVVHKISTRLIEDRWANATSAFVAVYGVTLINPRVINDHVAPRFRELAFVEWRGLPIFEKFTNSNGVPLGTVFFLLCVYTLVEFSCGRWTIRHALLLFVSLIGCAFFYPPMLPGLGVGCLAVWLVMAFRRREMTGREFLSRSTIMAASGVIAVLLAIPYLKSVGSGLLGRTIFFGPRETIIHLQNLGLSMLPLGALIFWQRHWLWKHTRKEVLVALGAIWIASAAVYLMARQPLGTEYKYLMMSALCFGIVGGVAIAAIRKRVGLWAYVVVIAIAMFNPVYEITKKLNWRANDRVVYVENGKDVHSSSGEEEELYRWIRESTPLESAFIDTQKRIPVFGQRSMYAAFDKGGLDIVDVYEFFWVPDRAELGRRQKLATKIAAGLFLSADDKARVESYDGPIFVVDRENKLPGGLQENDWQLAFTTSTGRNRVFQYVGEGR